MLYAGHSKVSLAIDNTFEEALAQLSAVEAMLTSCAPRSDSPKILGATDICRCLKLPWWHCRESLVYHESDLGTLRKKSLTGWAGTKGTEAKKWATDAICIWHGRHHKTNQPVRYKGGQNSCFSSHFLHYLFFRWIQMGQFTDVRWWGHCQVTVLLSS